MSLPAAPIACTLRPGELDTRLKEIAALSSLALLSASRDDLVLHLLYAPQYEPSVRSMVTLEQQCCAFLAFDCQPTPQGFALRITAPEAARDTVQELFAQFLPS